MGLSVWNTQWKMRLYVTCKTEKQILFLKIIRMSASSKQKHAGIQTQHNTKNTTLKTHKKMDSKGGPDAGSCWTQALETPDSGKGPDTGSCWTPERTILDTRQLKGPKHWIMLDTRQCRGPKQWIILDTIQWRGPRHWIILDTRQ